MNRCCRQTFLACVTGMVASNLGMAIYQAWPEAPRVPVPRPPITTVNDPRIYDGAGLCVYEALRERVAPNSKGRKLTPHEEAMFEQELKWFNERGWK